jgi:TRAP transporter 4TM/12TM fusion protein
MKWSKVIDIAIAVVGIGMGMYHLISTQRFLQGPIEHQDTHLGFALLLVFLTTMKKKIKLWPITLIFLLASIVTTVYIRILVPELEIRAGSPTLPDIVIGFILLIVMIEATREAFGPILPLIGILAILYFFFGQYLPYPFGHSGFKVARVISHLDIGLTGVFGTVLGVSANYIFLFILFGGILQASGAMEFFLQLGKLAGRKLAGGPALTAVISSGLVGMVSGSAVANVGITGAFTIPLMKKVGYKPEHAGAIEAAASSGGQIMPPIMGAAAFVLADLVGVRYIWICAMCAIPALLYFLTCGLYAQFQGMKLKIQPPVEEINMRELLLRMPLFVVPLILLTGILIKGYSPMYAAFWAIISVFLLSIIRKTTRPSIGAWMKGFVQGASGGAAIAVASGCIGSVIKTLTVTGLGLKIGGMVETWSGGNLFIAAILVMILSVMFGCGMPTLAAYLLVAVVTAPVLMSMGVSMVQAHLFAFFFAIFSAVTPPVAVAALVASGIAGGGYIRTAKEAVKAAFAGFLLPFLIIWCPVIILTPWEPVLGITALIAITLGIVAISAGFANHYLTDTNLLERTLITICGAVLFGYAFTQQYLFFAMGVGLFAVLTLGQWRKRRKLRLFGSS